MKRSFSKKNLWENMPQSLKGPLGSVAGLIPLPFILGKTYRRWDDLVGASDAWSKETVLRFQLDRLREMCVLAYEKSSYYRQMFEESSFDPASIQCLEDLEALPLIDKQSINKHGDEMLTVDKNDSGLDYVATGGSGGEPMRFLIGKDRSAIEYAHLVRGWSRVGYSHGTPKAVLRGQVLKANRSGLHYSYDPLLRNHSYSNFHMDDATMSRYLDHIATIGPCFLHTYPSSLGILVRFMRRHEVTAPANIKGILLESENFYQEDRRAAEDLFGVRCFSSYGHSEKLVMATECEHSDNYHVFPTYGYFELIDADGRRVSTPGLEGEIVGTGFINQAMPFIRYRTGDYATYVADHCEACGRQHVVIKDIRGHNTMETLVAKDGSLIPYAAVNVHDDTFEGVLQFQFVQDEPGKATLRLIPADSAADLDLGKLARNLSLRLQGRVSISPEIVDEIKLTPRGKSVFVDQRIGTMGRKGRPN